MVEKDRFLVVVSVLEGRKFPKRPKHRLIVEARFDGELLATDPIHHVESPDFTQELAWELDKKGLHQHRMQRTSIKVQVYAEDSSSTMREGIGYVVLDLRSAQTAQTSKWCPLLHSKYSKCKPEVKLSLYIDDDKGAADASFKAKGAPPRPVTAKGTVDPMVLKPVLNDAEGYYQIGPEGSCNEQFLLAVTVSFAANLPQVIPTSIPLPSTGYFFYYSLLGNDVTNEVFYDLLNPTFPPERASVKIRSSVEALRAFFTSQPGLQVHLCCGDQSLGNCEVPLLALLKKGSTEIYMKPVSIEGAFPLKPPNRLKDQLAPVSDEMKPVVGVSVILRKEDGPSHTPSKEAKKTTTTVQTKSPSPKTSPSARKPPRSPPPRLPSPPPRNDDSYSETFDSASRTDDQAPNLRQDNRAMGDAPIQQKQKQQVAIGDSPVQQRQKQQAVHDDVPSSSTQQHLAVSTQPHHFGVSIDLRSIRDLRVQHSANVFLKYTYGFFGSSSPIMTHPPVEVRKGMEVVMPQSFCTFDFATTLPQLEDTFKRIPLMVEVWDREKDRSQNTMLGAVHLQLSSVLAEQRSRAVHASGMNGWRQVWSERLPILNAQGQSEKLGDLTVVVSLEDWGAMNAQKVVVGTDTSQASTLLDGAAAGPAQEPRETQEYAAAIELEMWKDQQETMFHSKLKQKEIQHMKVLAEEWKKRDKERELVTTKKIQEYARMEGQLKKKVGELEKRDKVLGANEQEVLRLRTDLEREHERKMTEMREASRRMQEDFQHQVHLEKAKTKELEEYIVRLRAQLAEQEAKTKELALEFARYKQEQNTKPEVRLQSEINLLTLEKVELERKQDALTKSKVHYKQQWGRALKELARLKQKEQTAAKANLKKQQQELEHMRLRYLAAEEKEVVKTERRELEDIKNELNQLRDLHSQQDSSQEMSKTYQPLYPDAENYDSPDDDHITRLIEERDSLLRTGAYTAADSLISELDRQIREAIARKGR